MSAIDPPSIGFSVRDRARERIVVGVYQVITQGLEGTTMQSFAFLPAEDRCALAFHAGRFAFPDVAEGERIWHAHDHVRRLIPNMSALAETAQAALADKLGADLDSAVPAYWRGTGNASGRERRLS